MIELFQIIYRWRKYIISISMLAILLSSIITMPAIMPPYFESKMIFYVSNPQSTDRANLFNQESVGNVSMFGSRDDADRFISIAKSSAVVNPILEKYNLSQHYQIKQKTNALLQYYTKKEFMSLVDIQRNDADAVEISVLDTDAELAAKIAKDLTHETEKITQQITRDNKQKVLHQIETLLAEKIKESNLTNKLEIENIEKLKDLKNQYSISINDNFKSIYIVEDAAVSPKKAKPVRWQIVLFALLVTLASTILFAVLYEQIKYANQAE